MANQQELIDQYHSGQMSPDQMVNFEKQLASNPELMAESDFQSDIINGLKEVRKAELKARLNSIEMGSSWMEFAMQSSLVKSFGGVAVATLIGSGVYLYAEKQDVPVENPQSAIEISAPHPQAIDYQFQKSLTLADVKDSKKESTSQLVESVAKSKPAIVSDDKKVVTEEKPKAIVPDFNAPTASLVEDETNFESANLDEIPQVASDREKEIDVETENVKNVNIKYKYYDGKLFLSGDFDQAPYEILEINSATGRRIYIQYLDKYYQVKTTDKLSDLPQVVDERLIKELKLLKASK